MGVQSNSPIAAPPDVEVVNDTKYELSDLLVLPLSVASFTKYMYLLIVYSLAVSDVSPRPRP